MRITWAGYALRSYTFLTRIQMLKECSAKTLYDIKMGKKFQLNNV
jgi:hypothetical protein